MSLWKRELQEQAPSLFDAKRGLKPADSSASSEHLYSEIGRLKMELDRLKKNPGSITIKVFKQWISSIEPLALTRQCELTSVAHSRVYAPKQTAKLDEWESSLLLVIDTEYTQQPQDQALPA